MSCGSVNYESSSSFVTPGEKVMILRSGSSEISLKMQVKGDAEGLWAAPSMQGFR